MWQPGQSFLADGLSKTKRGCRVGSFSTQEKVAIDGSLGILISFRGRPTVHQDKFLRTTFASPTRFPSLLDLFSLLVSYGNKHGDPKFGITKP